MKPRIYFWRRKYKGRLQPNVLLVYNETWQNAMRRKYARRPPPGIFVDPRGPKIGRRPLNIGHELIQIGQQLPNAFENNGFWTSWRSTKFTNKVKFTYKNDGEIRLYSRHQIIQPGRCKFVALAPVPGPPDAKQRNREAGEVARLRNHWAGRGRGRYILFITLDILFNLPTTSTR